ncbi:CGNR zinc finger domain-containing protein [Microtetraspora glauca]|uniref:CGNR zinc finger domain-containing protein n=1 Tax=unclassified Streptomyces TaxID=2593676 RepID=UPI002AA519FC
MTTAQDASGREPSPRGTHAGVALIGGHPVLDFANTVAWRTDPDRRVARVTGAEAWLRWAVGVELLTAQETAALLGSAPPDPAGVTLLETWRSTLWAVLDALVDDLPLPAEPWEKLRLSIATARQEAFLAPELPLRWQVRVTRCEDLAHALALRADELLASPADIRRIRRCEGPGCGWFFLDRSRSGTRRWCSSGDCGNRDRARRHYHRSRA